MSIKAIPNVIVNLPNQDSPVYDITTKAGEQVIKKAKAISKKLPKGDIIEINYANKGVGHEGYSVKLLRQAGDQLNMIVENANKEVGHESYNVKFLRQASDQLNMVKGYFVDTWFSGSGGDIAFADKNTVVKAVKNLIKETRIK